MLLRQINKGFDKCTQVPHDNLLSVNKILPLGMFTSFLIMARLPAVSANSN